MVVNKNLYSLPDVKGEYRFDYDLSKTNWFNIGGPAQILYRPYDVEDLSHFIKNKPQDLKITILGVGSNLLIRDGGIEGAVIKLTRNFNYCNIKSDNILRFGAATLCYHAAIFAANNNIAGLEFLSGIPGSMGGALAMNAGAYNSEIADILVSADIIDNQGNLKILAAKDIKYKYRANGLTPDNIFVAAEIKGFKADKAEIMSKIQKIQELRSDTQPIKSKTGGSTFKNPPGAKKAWQLIEEAGCRGLKKGGAQVSEKHCNFFINYNKASAADMEDLGEEVRKKVFEKSGIMLEWEVQIIGKKL